MSLHDEYARITPFEIAFPEEGKLEDLVKDVLEEASSRRVDASLPGIFLTLGSVDDFLRRLLSPDAPEGARTEYGALVFQAVHFILAGRPLYLLETAVTRRLVEVAPDADPRPPDPAGYVQLPQHLFWVDGTDGGVPESLDGLFWVASDRGALHVLPITGILPEAPGFRALPLPEAPLADARHWLHADMRGDASDYTSSLPGHALDRLYSVETAGEVFKLLARFFAYADSAHVAARPTPPAVDQGPRPSVLPYARVGVVA